MNLFKKLNDLTLSGSVKCQQHIEAIKNDERGVTMIEYVMLAVLVTTMIIALWKTQGIQQALEAGIQSITKNITDAGTP